MSLSLGNWFGVPVNLHWSWLLFMFIVAYSNPMFGLLFGVLFLIVLLHEFGHCLAGRYYGIEAQNVTLYPFGGVALMKMPTSSKQEIVVALAGPAVNVALIPLLWLCNYAYPHDLIKQICDLNLVILCFNLLPVFPMDGGRVFRALLALLLKDHAKATIFAGSVSQGICIAAAVFTLLTGVGGLNILIVAMFIFFVAGKEIELARNQIMIRETHELLTGVKFIGTSDCEIEKSSKMLEEIQMRLSSVDRNNQEV
jgi:Zn-dependent protease